jgi:hypothetical protein
MKQTNKMLSIIGIVLTFLVANIGIANAQTSPGYSLSPASSTLTPGSTQTINLRISTGTQTATSFVAAIDVTGTSVPSNLSFNPIAPSGMTAYHAVANITGGKQI